MQAIQSKFQGEQRPVRVLQYGEGNFLRAFADYMIDVANQQGLTDLGVAVVKPIEYGSLDVLREQNHLYTVYLRGAGEEGVIQESRVVRCLQQSVDPYTEYEDYISLAELPELRFVISNTTEAGIVYREEDRLEDAPPVSYPGKLTQLLYRRYRKFGGDVEKGLVILPCELIEDNGSKLKTCVEQTIANWMLPAEFAAWVKDSCIFCSTLVDRIVTGSPQNAAELQQELGYEDKLLDVAEPFGLWVIESERDFREEFPLDKAGQPVVFTRDHAPYRERKVRILNGSHTASVLAGYLMGMDIVYDCVKHPDLRKLMDKTLMEEIVPTVKLPDEERNSFARSVFTRFENPFVNHALLSISLNSVSKWKARLLPTLKDRVAETGQCPTGIAFSLAALLAFYGSGEYRDSKLFGRRQTDNGENEYEILDDADVLRFFGEHLGKDDYAKAILANQSFWGENLTQIPGLLNLVEGYLTTMKKDGMAAAVKEAAGA